MLAATRVLQGIYWGFGIIVTSLLLYVGFSKMSKRRDHPQGLASLIQAAERSSLPDQSADWEQEMPRSYNTEETDGQKVDVVDDNCGTMVEGAE